MTGQERVMVTVHHMLENFITKAIISCSEYIYILTMLLTFKSNTSEKKQVHLNKSLEGLPKEEKKNPETTEDLISSKYSINQIMKMNRNYF